MNINMNKRLILPLGVIFYTLLPILNLNAQGDGSSDVGLADKTRIELKLNEARNRFHERNLREALNVYREVLVMDKNNARALYRMGEINLLLHYYDMALENLERVKEIDPAANKEFFYTYGKALHRMYKLDEAIEAFKTFIGLRTERQLRDFDAEEYIKQCELAKKMIANSVDIDIVNVGRSINSRHDEYNPTVSMDGKTMIFTARRPDTKGGGIDTQFDHKYYESIYISEWDEEKGTWGESELIPGRINTEFHDANLSISPDGEYIFVYKNIPGATKSGDIYFSRKSKSGKWGAPKPLPKTINTSYWESGASLTLNGDTLFFLSEKPKGFGGSDIYMSIKQGRDWGPAVNLGPTINTAEDENSVFIHPNGRTLFFSSKGHNTMGGYDIFKSDLVDGQWTTPVNLGYPINTTRDDLHFVMLGDSLAYLSGIRDEGIGGRDIYAVNLSRYPILEPDFIVRTHGTLSGTVVSEDGAKPLVAEIKFYFAGTNDLAGSTTSTKDGSYSISLEGNKQYDVVVKSEGYSDVKSKVRMTLEERKATLLHEHFIMSK
jgi:tetratricopeptide (TPR) repeat protein